MANLCQFNVPTEFGSADIAFAEHCNGAINSIKFNGANFAAPSMSPIAGMSSSAVFDLKPKQKACQKRLSERGCEDVLIHDEISDVAFDDRSFLVTTKMMSESIPSEKKGNLMNFNDAFVSDVVHTKKIRNLAPGSCEYIVKLGIPAKYTFGIVEVLSATFFNDILIQLIKEKDGWGVLNNGTYSNAGFVIARDPETAMGIVLTDWPKGAVAFPPKIHYNEFENANRWSVTQQLGSPLNDSVKIPGGEYAWRFEMFFGPIWFCQTKINGISQESHGNSHKILYADDVVKRKIQVSHRKNKHAHGYDFY
jgi:hypothetical protein